MLKKEVIYMSDYTRYVSQSFEEDDSPEEIKYPDTERNDKIALLGNAHEQNCKCHNALGVYTWIRADLIRCLVELCESCTFAEMNCNNLTDCEIIHLRDMHAWACDLVSKLSDAYFAENEAADIMFKALANPELARKYC